MASVLKAPGQRRRPVSSRASTSSLSETPSSDQFRRNFILHSYKESSARGGALSHPGTKKLRRWANDNFLGVACNRGTASALREGAIHAGFYLRANDPTPFNVTFPRDLLLPKSAGVLKRYLGGEGGRAKDLEGKAKEGTEARPPDLKRVEAKLRDVLSRLVFDEGAARALAALEQVYLEALGESGERADEPEFESRGDGNFESAARTAFVETLGKFLDCVPTATHAKPSPGRMESTLTFSFSPSAPQSPLMRMLLYATIQFHGRDPLLGRPSCLSSPSAPRFSTSTKKGGVRCVVVSWAHSTITSAVPEEEEDLEAASSGAECPELDAAAAAASERPRAAEEAEVDAVPAPSEPATREASGALREASPPPPPVREPYTYSLFRCASEHFRPPDSATTTTTASAVRLSPAELRAARERRFGNGGKGGKPQETPSEADADQAARGGGCRRRAVSEDSVDYAVSEDSTDYGN